MSGIAVDTSAILAVLLAEPDAEFFVDELAKASVVRVGAPTAVECAMLLEKAFPHLGRSRFDEWLTRTGAAIVSFSEDHFRIAHDAYLAFGKGKHPAALNFGDCMSYAVALREDFPLLYKGIDFGQTTGIQLLTSSSKFLKK